MDTNPSMFIHIKGQFTDILCSKHLSAYRESLSYGFQISIRINTVAVQKPFHPLQRQSNTSSARILEQLKQTQRIIVRTVFMNPI